MSDTSPIWPAGLGVLMGAVGGYLVAQHVASRDAAVATRDAYRRGLQDGHNRLAARHARKTRKALAVTPRALRATFPDGM